MQAARRPRAPHTPQDDGKAASSSARTSTALVRGCKGQHGELGAEGSITLRRSAADVYAFLTRTEHLQTWNPSVLHAEVVRQEGAIKHVNQVRGRAPGSRLWRRSAVLLHARAACARTLADRKASAHAPRAASWLTERNLTEWNLVRRSCAGASWR
jgi:hypothetical protein